MGADGHIKIYDADKLKELLPNVVHDGNVYHREIFGRKVVTMYFDTEYIEKTCMICGKYGCDNFGHQESIIELDKVALIARWMVWT